MAPADTNRFDHPLPILSIDTANIKIETKDIFKGSFTIKNSGGGTLEGKILPRCKGLIFDAIKWEGNMQTVNYTFDSASLSAGQSTEGFVYISSNGGEKCIPVFARHTKMSITTDERFTITGIRDFFQYANTYPIQAQRLFVDSEFYMLLLAIGYDYVDIYESLHRDPNRERAMDNFFILSGLKGKTTISIADKKLDFTQKPEDKKILQGSITAQKSDGGYAEAPITLQKNAPWLNFSSNKLTQHDFKDSRTATIQFEINPAKIIGPYTHEFVTIGTETVQITYHRTAPAILQLNRAAYCYEDNGLIKVVNNTGKNMRIEVFCPESYVRFSARSYLIEAYGEIPFTIKLSTFLSAQMFFRKLPYMKTTIEVKATIPGELYLKNLPIVVGEW